VNNILLAHVTIAGQQETGERCDEAMAALARGRQRRPSRSPYKYGRGGDTGNNVVLTARARPEPLIMGAERLTPSSGASIVVRGSFQVTVSDVWISGVYEMMRLSEFANTVTVLDAQVTDAFGPCGFCASGGGNGHGTRVDIWQMSRVTANNSPAANRSTVWIDIGAGVNTVRLDNVGLINGVLLLIEFCFISPFYSRHPYNATRV